MQALNEAEWFMNATETVFNEEHLDINFRIEGDTLPSLFHVDAGEDSLGINTLGVSRFFGYASRQIFFKC